MEQSEAFELKREYRERERQRERETEREREGPPTTDNATNGTNVKKGSVFVLLGLYW